MPAETRPPGPTRQPGSPLLDAAGVRRDVAAALHSEGWYSETVTPEVAACLIGIDTDILRNTHVAVLFHQAGDGYVITAGTTRQVAMEAFRSWNTDPNTKSQNTFARDAYMTLYRMFQAAHEGMGDVVFAEIAELFVTTLAEQDPTWIPFLERIQGYGDIAGDADARIIGEKMDDLWQSIPRGMRSQLASFSPEHMYQ